jgi:IS30 family transposase
LRGHVQQGLDRWWSPGQIAHPLRAQFPDNPAWHLVRESIYQAIYAKDASLGRDRFACLATGRRRRRPDRKPDARRLGMLRAMTMTGDRPAEVADRAVPGHQEGDLVTGAANRSAIGTLVERNTRYVLVVHVPAQHTADATSTGAVKMMTALPADLRRSLTWDQGKEMVGHLQITAATGMRVYFCEPHSPWQRGTNENTNGLLRDYFPNGTNLAVHSAQRLLQVQDELNNRPPQDPGTEVPNPRPRTTTVDTFVNHCCDVHWNPPPVTAPSSTTTPRSPGYRYTTLTDATNAMRRSTPALAERSSVSDLQAADLRKRAPGRIRTGDTRFRSSMPGRLQGSDLRQCSP